MKRIQFIIAFLFFALAVSAQTTFINTVKIEFEKTVYMKQLYRQLYNPRTYDIVKNQIPETAVSYFDFIGDTTKSIFKPGRQSSYDPRWVIFANENVVYTDYQSQKNNQPKTCL